MDRRNFIKRITAASGAIALGAPFTKGLFSFYDPQYALIAAARDNDLLGIQTALSCGAKINKSLPSCFFSKDETTIYHTALHEAARNDSKAAIDLLLRSGANPNEFGAGQYSFAPLCLVKSTEAASLLLNADANTNPTDSGEITSQLYCQLSNKPVFELLLDYGADINKMNNCGCTLLGIGICWSFTAIDIQYLIDKGSRLDVIDEDENSALKKAKMRVAHVEDDMRHRLEHGTALYEGYHEAQQEALTILSVIEKATAPREEIEHYDQIESLSEWNL